MFIGNTDGIYARNHSIRRDNVYIVAAKNHASRSIDQFNGNNPRVLGHHDLEHLTSLHRVRIEDDSIACAMMQHDRLFDVTCDEVGLISDLIIHGICLVSIIDHELDLFIIVAIDGQEGHVLVERLHIEKTGGATAFSIDKGADLEILR